MPWISGAKRLLDRVHHFLKILDEHQRLTLDGASCQHPQEPTAERVTRAASDAVDRTYQFNDRVEHWGDFAYEHPRTAIAASDLAATLLRNYQNHKYKKVGSHAWPAEVTTWVGELKEKAYALDRALRGETSSGGWESIRADELTRSITVHGERFTFARPAVYTLASKLIEARGEVITSSQLKELPGCKGRLDQLIKKYAGEFGTRFIQSSTGPGGGYWFRLPDTPQSDAQ